MARKFLCPQVIAHRGASYYAPENTQASIELATTQGATWVEVDLQLTQDNNIIIMHDSTVNKRTDGKGKIIKLNRDDIIKLDAGTWHSLKYAKERVLFLEELIKLVNRLNINVNLEIKTLAKKSVEVATIVANILRKHWPEKKALPLISSSSVSIIKTILKVFPKAPRAIIIDRWNNYWAKIAGDLECISINADYRLIDEKSIADIHKLDKKILVYTVNSLKSAISLTKMEVDGIFTDRPDIIIGALKKNNLYRGRN